MLFWKFQHESFNSILCFLYSSVHWIIIFSNSDCVKLSVMLEVISNFISDLISLSFPFLLNHTKKGNWYLNFYWFNNLAFIPAIFIIIFLLWTTTVPILSNFNIFVFVEFAILLWWKSVLISYETLIILSVK